jgi:hypothetical protein
MPLGCMCIKFHQSSVWHPLLHSAGVSLITQWRHPCFAPTLLRQGAETLKETYGTAYKLTWRGRNLTHSPHDVTWNRGVKLLDTHIISRKDGYWSTWQGKLSSSSSLTAGVLTSNFLWIFDVIKGLCLLPRRRVCPWLFIIFGWSHWSCCVIHEMPSLAWTQRSWVRIPLEACLSESVWCSCCLM